VGPPHSAVTLSEVVASVEAEVRDDDGRRIVDASYDSRDVTPGSLFFCVRGEHADGHAYAAEALSAGAGAFLVDNWLSIDAPQARVESVRKAMGPVSAALFGRPAEALTTIGVTGTNGKTTVTYLIEATLRRAGMAPGVIGTTGVRIDGRRTPLERTTPEAPDLHRLFARMLREGVRAVTMEVSSHALAQDRVGGVRYDAAVFTNLTQDHLDYHGTMQEYFEAKAELFTAEHASMGLINIDDEWGRRLAASAAIPVVTYAAGREADLRATDIVVGADGLSFRLGDVVVRSELRGPFNVENCLAALGVARAVGIDLNDAAAAIEGVAGVPGRMEPVDAGQPFLALVDYAHTPDSIRLALRASRALTRGRVIVVFGCGGDRDRGKRPLMGAAATSSADLTVITSDNPRSEAPRAIIEDILPGAIQGGGEYVVEPDRREAIRLAVRQAAPGDVVVIAGKGHEPYQELAGATVPFDDRLVAREELMALGGQA
jgi:UDP-N-acetylmuramoyl-L-alanyl-D-glutamate--2,6-diaminopimelate ligase